MLELKGVHVIKTGPLLFLFHCAETNMGDNIFKNHQFGRTTKSPCATFDNFSMIPCIIFDNLFVISSK